MKLVPSKSGGSSRRSYQRGYAKSASAKQSDALGNHKLRSDAIKPAKQPGAGASLRRSVKIDTPSYSADFGPTGYTEEERS